MNISIALSPAALGVDKGDAKNALVGLFRRSAYQSRKQYKTLPVYLSKTIRWWFSGSSGEP